MPLEKVILECHSFQPPFYRHSFLPAFIVRSFTCFDQFLCMAFAQLTYRESLRDIECCLRAMREKLYHMGIKGKISRSTIAYANENRDWRIYCDFAQILIHQARQLYSNDDFDLQLQETDEIRLESLHNFTDFEHYSF